MVGLTNGNRGYSRDLIGARCERAQVYCSRTNTRTETNCRPMRRKGPERALNGHRTELGLQIQVPRIQEPVALFDFFPNFTDQGRKNK
jgi:hypothetical protein